MLVLNARKSNRIEIKESNLLEGLHSLLIKGLKERNTMSIQRSFARSI